MAQFKNFYLCYELEKPLQIGYMPNSKDNVIARTRYYVPGKNIWGGLTCNIAENIMKDSKYYEVNRLLQDNFIFSYFYVTDETETLLMPEYDLKNGLKYGNEFADDFEHKFIGSFMSTAKNEYGGTKESTLHENEFILSQNKMNKKKVKIAGIVTLTNEDSFIKNNLGLAFEVKDAEIILNGQNIFDNISVGGDQNYGHGKLKLLKVSEKLKNQLNSFYSYLDTLTYENDSYTVRLNLNEQQNKTILRTHCRLNDNICYYGNIELLGGRATTSAKQKGRNLKIENSLYLVPGTVISNVGETKELKFKINNFGVLFQE